MDVKSDIATHGQHQTESELKELVGQVNPQATPKCSKRKERRHPAMQFSNEEVEGGTLAVARLNSAVVGGSCPLPLTKATCLDCCKKMAPNVLPEPSPLRTRKENTYDYNFHYFVHCFIS